MNEQRITPRSSAFPRAPRDAALSADATAAAEAARASSVELAVHGDPSMRHTNSDAEQNKNKDDKRLRVDWVRPTDLAARAGSGSLAHSAEWNMRAHKWLRAQPRRVVNAGTDLARRLPPISRFGQARSTNRPAPTRSAPSR